MADVFISYVEEDSPVACRISDGLRDAGFSTWLYERDILPGLSYLIQTGDAVSSCRALVLLITSSSIGSNQVGAEVVRAFEENKPLVPLRLGISHVDMQRRQPVWRQALGSSASIAIDQTDIDATVRRVVAGLHALSVQPGEKDEGGQTHPPVHVVASVKCDVFLAGKNRHQEFLGRVARYLQASGIAVFDASVRTSEGDMDRFRTVNEALDSARLLVVVGKSREDFSDGWTSYYWQSFMAEKNSGRKPDGKVHPLLLDPDLALDNLPFALRQVQPLRCDPEQPEETFEALKKMYTEGRGGEK